MISLKTLLKLTRNPLIGKIFAPSNNKNLEKLFLAPFSTSKCKHSSENGRAKSIASLKDLVSKIRVYDEIDLAAADLDWDFILDKANLDRIDRNAKIRKSPCEIAELVGEFFMLYALIRSVWF